MHWGRGRVARCTLKRSGAFVLLIGGLWLVLYLQKSCTCVKVDLLQWAVMKQCALVVVMLVTVGIGFGQTAKVRKADAEIRQEIIKRSIAAYKGSCPCPYNVDRAGRTCGARSAYSKAGGASPLCYERDVTQKMVDDYRKETGPE